MSDSTSSADKSSNKSSESKPKDSGSGDTASKSDKAGGDAAPKSDKAGGDAGKSAKELVGGAADVHYGFFSSVRSPAYRSGWDDIWGNDSDKPRRKAPAKRRSNSNSKTAKPVAVALKIEDLPADIRDGLVEVARKKMRKSRSSYDELDSRGRVDWTISVTVNGSRS